MTNLFLPPEVKLHAARVHPAECCGFVCNDGSIVESKNQHKDPENNWKTTAAAYRKATAKGRTIVAIYHSHTKEEHPATLTYADIASCKKSGIPYWLYHTEYKTTDYYDPASINPYPLTPNNYQPTGVDYYLGRQYQWWRADCWRLVADYFAGMLSISIADSHRSADEDEWKQPRWNRYVEELPELGFVRVEGDLRQHDLILMHFEGTAPHHIGIITDAKQRHFIHHMSNRLSERSVFGGFWKERLHSIWRHQSLC